MGKPTGFIEYQRQENLCLDPEARIQNWNEFHLPLSAAQRQMQGARCMNCGVPFCQSAIRLKGMVTGCPLHNLIPEWNDDVYHGNFTHALSRLLQTSSFPEFTARVCPALCEKACVCGLHDEPVSIRENELFIIETAFACGDMTPRPPKVRTQQRVAVIGSGPAGLAAADRLNKRGHFVTVFEKADRIGGLLMYGIPNMKLEKHIIDRRVRLMRQEGVRFVVNADVGKTVPAEKILQEYDAVILACGARQPRVLPVKTEGISGIYNAVDFLTAATRNLLDPDGKKDAAICAAGKRVVVIGGGDTGNDCVATCIRQGCRSVVQLEMMPRAPEERPASNPWPEWPKTCKTDYGQQEAIAKFGKDPRIFETTVEEVLAKDGCLTGVRTVGVHFQDGALVPCAGTQQELPADLLLIAAGFCGCEAYTAEAFGICRTERGQAATRDNGFATENNKVFAAGDMRRGQSLVVWAISEGRACAKEVDKFLMGYTNLE